MTPNDLCLKSKEMYYLGVVTCSEIIVTKYYHLLVYRIQICHNI